METTLESPAQQDEDEPQGRDHLAIQFERMLKTNRPRMYRELEAAGELEILANRAADNYRDMVAHLVMKGEPAMQAQSEASRTYLILPMEKDVPDLSQNPYDLP